MIGVLRESGRTRVAPPQPTLDAIPALIEESRAAGMRVRSRIEAGGGEAMVGRTAYRVVQEGLTNARKHAPAAAVEVDRGRRRAARRGGRQPALRGRRSGVRRAAPA